jgi:hypothetical protein
MNFTYVIILPKVLEFGAKSNNGSWSGMVAQISSGEIDIGNFLSNFCVLFAPFFASKCTIFTIIYHFLAFFSFLLNFTNTVKPMYNDQPWDLKKVAFWKRGPRRGRFRLVVDELNRPLLTGGRCSEVVVKAALTVLNENYHEEFWEYLIEVLLLCLLYYQ